MTTDSQTVDEEPVEAQAVEGPSVDDLELLEAILGRVATNLTMLIDREIELNEVTTERCHERPAGASQVHISFMVGFRRNGADVGHGSILVPLPEAIAMACYLMMFSEREVESHRDDTELDESMKEAMIELGSFLASAVDESVRIFESEVRVVHRGCQGVRAGVRPALPYDEGDELLVGRAKVRLHDSPEFDMILMLPPLFG